MIVPHIVGWGLLSVLVYGIVGALLSEFFPKIAAHLVACQYVVAGVAAIVVYVWLCVLLIVL